MIQSDSNVNLGALDILLESIESWPKNDHTMGANINGLLFHSVPNMPHFLDLHGPNQFTVSMIHTHVDYSICKKTFISLQFCMVTKITFSDEEDVEVHRT